MLLFKERRDYASHKSVHIVLLLTTRTDLLLKLLFLHILLLYVLGLLLSLKQLSFSDIFA